VEARVRPLPISVNEGTTIIPINDVGSSNDDDPVDENNMLCATNDVSIVVVDGVGTGHVWRQL